MSVCKDSENPFKHIKADKTGREAPKKARQQSLRKVFQGTVSAGSKWPAGGAVCAANIKDTALSFYTWL